MLVCHEFELRGWIKFGCKGETETEGEGEGGGALYKADRADHRP